MNWIPHVLYLLNCTHPLYFLHPWLLHSLTTIMVSVECVSVCTRLVRVCESFSRVWVQCALWVRRHCSTRSSSLCMASRRRCSSSSRASRTTFTWANTRSLALFASVYQLNSTRDNYNNILYYTVITTVYLDIRDVML